MTVCGLEQYNDYLFSIVSTDLAEIDPESGKRKSSKTLEFGPADDTLLLAIGLARVMFPYILLIGVASLLMAILNSHGRFFSSVLLHGYP